MEPVVLNVDLLLFVGDVDLCNLPYAELACLCVRLSVFS